MPSIKRHLHAASFAAANRLTSPKLTSAAFCFSRTAQRRIGSGFVVCTCGQLFLERGVGSAAPGAGLAAHFVQPAHLQGGAEPAIGGGGAGGHTEVDPES